MVGGKLFRKSYDYGKEMDTSGFKPAGVPVRG
jgi:hypothetical protein